MVEFGDIKIEKLAEGTRITTPQCVLCIGEVQSEEEFYNEVEKAQNAWKIKRQLEILKEMKDLQYKCKVLSDEIGRVSAQGRTRK